MIISLNSLFAETYSIREVTYSIKGNTKEISLEQMFQIKKGSVFKTREELDSYISDMEQKIENQRVLLEGSVTPKFTKQRDVIYVDLFIYVKDSWNYVLLPYPKYDSNTGLSLGLRFKNYNFLGRMNTLAFDFDYIRLDNGGTDFRFGSDFKIPFYTDSVDWELYFSENFIIDSNYNIENKSELGLSGITSINSFTDLKASISQGYVINEEDKYYLETRGEVKALFYIEDFIYSPGIVTNYPYKPSGILSEERRGYQLGLAHSLSYGSIDWVGNLRKGFQTSVNQDLVYNFNKTKWFTNNKVEILYHKNFTLFGISSRVSGFYSNRNEDNSSIGQTIRGIRDKRISGDTALTFNLDFPCYFPLGPLKRWFSAQISPFIDYALVKPNNSDFILNKASWFGSGLEGFAYLNNSRSIYLRVSLGVDIKEIGMGTSVTERSPVDGDKLWELTIMVGHHY